MAKKIPSNSEMIAAIKRALADTPIGAVTIRLADGRSIQYDRKAALEELAYWERQEDVAANGAMVWGQVSLQGGHP